MIVWGGESTAPLTGGLYCAECVSHLWHQDADGDGHGDASNTQLVCTQPTGYVAAGDDCDDTNGSIWARPGEALSFTFEADRQTMSWLPPSSPGAVQVNYDVLRSGAPDDFQGGATCIGTPFGERSVTDVSVPAIGSAFYYLVRATNACPDGRGPLGYNSDGAEETGRSCP